MAATSRSANASLEEELLSRGHEFSFFQAMRLLLMLDNQSEVPSTVRVRPALDLCFPPADVQNVRKEAGTYSVAATFLGLYGPASPLPTFYTEALLTDSTADTPATQGFMDVINHLIFDLFHESTLKYRLFFQVAQLEREECLERLFCLIGLGEKGMRRQLHEPQGLLRYTALLSLQQRSALGLATFLGDTLQLPVEVVQCVPRRVPVPQEQRAVLGVAGCSLGSDAVLGSEVVDRTGIRLRLGPLEREEFEAYLPGTAGRAHLDALVRFYLREPMSWDLELIHLSGEAPAAGFGEDNGRLLGWNSWLAPYPGLPHPVVLFPNVPDDQSASLA